MRACTGRLPGSVLRPRIRAGCMDGTCGVTVGRSLRPIRSGIVTPSTYAILSPPCPRGSPSGRYSPRMSESRRIIGRWRITEMDNWDQETVDLVEPGFIEFDEDGLGGLGFIAVTGDSTAATRIVMAGRGSSSRGKAPTRATTWAVAAGLRSTPMARSRATSTSTLVMTPRSAPSGSTEPSGE
jgi:hypothetical protein